MGQLLFVFSDDLQLPGFHCFGLLIIWQLFRLNQISINVSEFQRMSMRLVVFLRSTTNR